MPCAEEAPAELSEETRRADAVGLLKALLSTLENAGEAGAAAAAAEHGAAAQKIGSIKSTAPDPSATAMYYSEYNKGLASRSIAAGSLSHQVEKLKEQKKTAQDIVNTMYLAGWPIGQIFEAMGANGYSKKLVDLCFYNIAKINKLVRRMEEDYSVELKRKFG